MRGNFGEASIELTKKEGLLKVHLSGSRGEAEKENRVMV